MKQNYKLKRDFNNINFVKVGRKKEIKAKIEIANHLHVFMGRTKLNLTNRKKDRNVM